ARTPSRRAVFHGGAAHHVDAWDAGSACPRGGRAMAERLAVEGDAPRVLGGMQGGPRRSSRYRHPGDVLRLIVAAVVLLAALVACVLAPDSSIGRDAGVLRGVEPGTVAGRLLVALVQVVGLVAAVAVVVSLLRRWRFRLLGM